jgi:hypothetical protein
MPGGGSRPGERRGGRQKGTPNKRKARLAAAIRAVQTHFLTLGNEPFEGDGVAFLEMVYRDPSLPLDIRIDAAKSAASFERPRLSAHGQRWSPDPADGAIDRGASGAGGAADPRGIRAAASRCGSDEGEPWPPKLIQ